MSMRFLSWECWDFWRLPKKSEVFRRSLKSSEDVWSLPKAKLSRKCLSTKSEIARKVLSFPHFTHGFRSLHGSELTNIFLEFVSSKMATTHIFQSGVRNWPTSVSRREIKVFNSQARDSRLRRESWQVYIMLFYTLLSSWCLLSPLILIYKCWLRIHFIGKPPGRNTLILSSNHLSHANNYPNC